jgi:hypothetical protein
MDAIFSPEAHERFLPTLLIVGAALFYGVVVPLVLLVTL